MSNEHFTYPSKRKKKKYLSMAIQFKKLLKPCKFYHYMRNESS